MIHEPYLVTGATGFIGRHVVRRLSAAASHFETVALPGETIDGVAVAGVDLSDPSSAAGWGAGRSFGTIIHLASAIPAGPAEDEDALRRNVLSMLNVLSLARRLNSRFVYASSCAVYGPLRPGETAAEDRLPAPRSGYAVSKYIGEILCEQLARSGSFSFAALRISSPYGPGSVRATVLNAFLRAAARNADITLFGSGSRMQDFVFIDDVVDAILAAVSASASGVFNVASGAPVTMRQLAESARAAAQSSSAIVLAGRPDPQEGLAADYPVRKARAELGWRPSVSLVEGLRLTLRDSVPLAGSPGNHGR